MIQIDTKIRQELQFMKIFKMFRGLFLKWSRGSKIMQDAISRVRLLA